MMLECSSIKIHADKSGLTPRIYPPFFFHVHFTLRSNGHLPVKQDSHRGEIDLSICRIKTFDLTGETDSIRAIYAPLTKIVLRPATSRSRPFYDMLTIRRYRHSCCDSFNVCRISRRRIQKTMNTLG